MYKGLICYYYYYCCCCCCMAITEHECAAAARAITANNTVGTATLTLIPGSESAAAFLSGRVS